jgi:hypothetical protein
MQVRSLNYSDYDNFLCGWWEDWGWNAPTRESLPENGSGGFVVEVDETPVCAGFLYETNSNMAWCEYIISNKKYTKENRSEAIIMLINFIALSAKDRGFKFVFTGTNNNPLKNKYTQCGFIETDKGITHMLKVWLE